MPPMPLLRASSPARTVNPSTRPCCANTLRATADSVPARESLCHGEPATDAVSSSFGSLYIFSTSQEPFGYHTLTPNHVMENERQMPKVFKFYSLVELFNVIIKDFLGHTMKKRPHVSSFIYLFICPLVYCTAILEGCVGLAGISYACSRLYWITWYQ